MTDFIMSKDQKRKVWEECEGAASAVIRDWMTQHPGEEPGDGVKEQCREVVQRIVDSGMPDCSNDDGNNSDDGVVNDNVGNIVNYAMKTTRRAFGVRISRTEDEWKDIFPRYPSSDRGDGFLKCFDHSDESGIKESLSTYGLCVVRVMNEVQCDVTISAMFEEMNELRRTAGIVGPDVSPTDPTTWGKRNWPCRSKYLARESAFHPTAFKNRCNTNIYDCFKAIFDEERLHVNIDRWGITRGAKINPSWKASLKPHWDVNPWFYMDKIDAGQHPGYQGLVALTDHTEETGCHLTLPGCEHFLRRWIKENPRPNLLNKKSAYTEADDPIAQHMQPIPLRRGEMVIWTCGQLHGCTESRSEEMRLTQFIRMYPAPEAGCEYDYEGYDGMGCNIMIPRSVRKNLMSLETLETAVTDQLSRRLLGLESWNDD